MKKLLFLMVLFSSFLSCYEEPVNCDNTTSAFYRRGAVCKDGSQTKATWKGACDGHGGVDYWLCTPD